MVKKKVNKKEDKTLNQGLLIVAILAILAVVFILVKTYSSETIDSDIAAMVNGEPIYLSELEEIKTLIIQDPSSAPQISDEELLKQLINKKLLVQAAKAEGIEVTEEYFATTMETYFSITGTDKEQFNSILETQGIEYEDFKADMLERLMIAQYMNDTINPLINIDEEIIKEQYDSNPELFSEPATIFASHILVEDKELAQELLTKLKSGEDFATLAKENSIDSSALNGGELGWFTAEDMVPSFSQAAFALDVGDISEVVQTQFGWHIIKVTDKNPARIVPWDEAKPQITAMLEIEEQNKLLLERIEELNKEADIKISEAPVITPNYTDTNKEICYEDGLPVIHMFSTSSCPHCHWVKPGFERVTTDYIEQGKINAHLWILDTGDDALTPEIEESVPEEAMQIFLDSNPQRTVPTMVFGCKYVRVGAVHEAKNDIAAEESDFRAIIDEVLRG